MAQVLPHVPGWGTVLGSALGQGIGGGLGSGLSALADLKMKELQQQQTAKKLAPLFERPGVSSEKAMAYAQAASINPQLGVQALKQAETERRMGPRPGMPLYQADQYRDNMGPQAEQGLGQVESAPFQGEQMTTPEAGLPDAPQDKYIKYLEDAWQTGDPKALDKARDAIFKAEEADRVADKKIEAAKTAKNVEWNRAYRKEKVAIGDSARNRRVRLLELKKGVLQGKIDSPAIVKIANKLGMPWLMSNDTNVLQKGFSELAIDIMKSTKGKTNMLVFGEILKSNPTLYTPAEVQLRVIDVLLGLVDMDELPSRITKETIEKRGLSGYDLQSVVDGRVDAGIQKISDGIMADIESSLQQKQLKSIIGKPSRSGMRKEHGGQKYVSRPRKVS